MIRKAIRNAGQTIFQTMLIISCVALAVGIFFPVYEFFRLYRGEPNLHKFERQRVSPRPAPAPPEPAKPEPAEEPAEPAEASEAPAPAEEPTAEEKPGAAPAEEPKEAEGE